MLSREHELFQSVKSLEYVCYRDSEATDDELKRLLRELPGAGVTLIELDEGEDSVETARTDMVDTEDDHIVSWKGITPCPETTLLLAGSPQTLALAKDTKMATVGFGSVTSGADILVEGFDEVDVQFLDRIMKRAQGLPWITVVTERCYLREITLDDLDDLFALYAQPGITDYTEPLYERPQEEQYTKDYIEKMYRFYGYGMWLVCDRESGVLMGRAGFSHQDLGDEIVLEMGYIIGVPYQRQGYATEVCEKLIAFARENLSDFGTLNCFVEPGNTASHGLIEKLHFHRIGMVKIGGKQMVRYKRAL